MAHRAEHPVGQRALDVDPRAKDQRVPDPHERDLAPDERLLQAAAHDVEVGPLRHVSPGPPRASAARADR